MRRARFQLSAWEPHHPSRSSASALSRVANFRGGTRHAAIPRAAHWMRRDRSRVRITRVRTKRRRGAFSRGRRSSVGEVEGERPNNAERGQPASASGLPFRSEGWQFRAGPPPICSRHPTSSAPHRRGLQPHGDCRPRGQACAKIGRAILRLPPDRWSHRFDRLGYARRQRRRPPLPEAAYEAFFPAFASDHLSGEAGARSSYSTPCDPSRFDRDQTGPRWRGVGSGPHDSQVTMSRTKRYRAALPTSTSSTKGTNAVRSMPAKSVSGSPTTGSQLSSRDQMPQRLNQRTLART